MESLCHQWEHVGPAELVPDVEPSLSLCLFVWAIDRPLPKGPDIKPIRFFGLSLGLSGQNILSTATSKLNESELGGIILSG